MAIIKVTGATGYLGNLISTDLEKNRHQVLAIKRELLYGNVNVLKNEIKGCDVIINLAGSPILQRWTKKNKKTIYDSRVETTKNLVKAINLQNSNEQPKKFISASAIGIYQPGMLHDESSTRYENKFVGKVVQDWEDCLNSLPDSIQLNIFRIGLVLGKNAKTITNLLRPLKLGLGGKIGSGKQAFPFIHEKDVINAFVWAVEDLKNNATFNLVAPERITNGDFIKTFAKKINRPAFIPVPAFVIKMILGEAASLLLKSPMVEPKVLLEAGFSYEYPTIDLVLEEILV